MNDYQNYGKKIERIKNNLKSEIKVFKKLFLISIKITLILLITQILIAFLIILKIIIINI